QLHRLGAVGRLAHDSDVGLRGQDRTEPGTDHRLVVGDEDGDRHEGTSRRGITAWMANPPAEVGPTVSVPPTSSTRSRMPLSPSPLDVTGDALSRSTRSLRTESARVCVPS